MLSCNYTKHLTQNQTLLKENSLSLKSEKPIRYKGELESNILTLALPQPNSHLLDLSWLPKYKLWKYNNQYALFQKDSLHPKLVKHKVERPALLDTLAIRHSEKMMKQFMLNQGYFYATVKSKIIPDKKPNVSSVEYQIETGKYYDIGRVTTEIESPQLKALIQSEMKKSVLVPGEPFSNFKCAAERERLYRLIRNKGYYDFKSDNIVFDIDTVNRENILRQLDDPFAQAAGFSKDSEITKTINVQLGVQATRDSTYDQLYSIDSVIVYLKDANISDDPNQSFIENELNQVYFKYKTLPVNRKVIVRNIFIQPGDIYSPQNTEQSINRLNQLGIFKFVTVTYYKMDDKPGKLNCIISLSTAPKMNLLANIDVSTSDGDYYVGSGAGITYRNKNLFYGANQFSFRVAGSIEFRNDNLLNGQKQFYRSGNNINISSNFTFPKFIVPFNQNIFSKRNQPFTILSAGYNYIQRVNNYTIINITGSYGFNWLETAHKSWRLNPAFLTVTRVPSDLLGESFKTKLENNSYLRKIFNDNIIYGENMTFEYRSPLSNLYGNFTTLKIGLEEAGTILKGVNYVYHAISADTIQPIAHYAKLETDYRHYTNFKKSQWVNRVMIGIGAPIGRNTTLPYIKQFSSGGAFSNRGWRARTLGPGRSTDTSFQTGVGVVDRTGDIKFEANSEYRFNLVKMFSGAINLKGAFFVDAGNVWLFNKNKDVPGGEINAKYFLQDIAISSGLGIRLDFSFFVFRVDLGYPIKQPQIMTDYGFAINKLTYKSGIWNFAIGYPF